MEREPKDSDGTQLQRFPGSSLRCTYSKETLPVNESGDPSPYRALDPRLPQPQATMRQGDGSAALKYPQGVPEPGISERGIFTAAEIPRRRTSQRSQTVQCSLESLRSREKFQHESSGRSGRTLSTVRPRDWGVSYTDTRELTAILDHYFVWDHYTYHFFDEEAFWEGLIAGGSEFCNKLLVHSIVAFSAVRHLIPSSSDMPC